MDPGISWIKSWCHETHNWRFWRWLMVSKNTVYYIIFEVQVFSGLITNCNHKLSSRWSHINAATSGCDAKQAFQRPNETEMDGLCVYRWHELTKGGNLKRSSLSMVTIWVKEAWESIPAEIVKKSFLKTGISNMMGLKTIIWGNWESSSKKKNQNKPGTQMSIWRNRNEVICWVIVMMRTLKDLFRWWLCDVCIYWWRITIWWIVQYKCIAHIQ